MATKKKKHKKKSGAGSHHKPRKVSGMAGIEHIFIQGISLVAGAVAGAFAINAFKTALSGQNLPAWVIPGGVMTSGFLVPLIAPKEPMLEAFGMGIAASGALMTLNETVISVPGISGMAMASNAPPTTPTLRKAVGAGPNAYLSQTVGAMSRRNRLKTIGALVSN